MQSPFLADEAPAIDQPQTVAAVLDEETLETLNKLIEIGVKAKAEAERQEAIYDSTREQVCAILRDLGEKSVETEVGKARTKETKSGWVFSEATTTLEKQVKLQQEIEKKTGVAKPTKVTLSADLFA